MFLCRSIALAGTEVSSEMAPVTPIITLPRQELVYEEKNKTNFFGQFCYKVIYIRGRCTLNKKIHKSIKHWMIITPRLVAAYWIILQPLCDNP